MNTAPTGPWRPGKHKPCAPSGAGCTESVRSSTAPAQNRAVFGRPGRVWKARGAKLTCHCPLTVLTNWNELERSVLTNWNEVGGIRCGQSGGSFLNYTSGQ